MWWWFEKDKSVIKNKFRFIEGKKMEERWEDIKKGVENERYNRQWNYRIYKK